MELNITLDDLAILVTNKKAFKEQVAEEVKKYTNELEINYMALKADLEVLKTKLAEQGVAIGVEFEQVKAKFEALKQEITGLKENVAALQAAVDELEGIDLTAEITAVTDSIAKIDEISESDVVKE
ncbi:MAG TPA: hypothetical protein PLP33_14855 [Leptospiraceae bacterium]|nr:hypothetical protein [Leptospiraceae bacterium]